MPVATLVAEVLLQVSPVKEYKDSILRCRQPERFDGEKSDRRPSHCPPWKGDVSFLWSLCLLPRQKIEQLLLHHWAVCRWKLALAEDWWDWTPGVIASTRCSVTTNIYLLSRVRYSPRCYASLSFVCNATDHFSLSCCSHLCESLCPTSFRTQGLFGLWPHHSACCFSWRRRTAKWCALKRGLEFSHFKGIWGV